MTAFRWGPQEEDTQKYKRKQKLYLSDRVSSSLCYETARNVAHAIVSLFALSCCSSRTPMLPALLLCCHLSWPLFCADGWD